MRTSTQSIGGDLFIGVLPSFSFFGFAKIDLRTRMLQGMAAQIAERGILSIVSRRTACTSQRSPHGQPGFQPANCLHASRNGNACTLVGSEGHVLLCAHARLLVSMKYSGTVIHARIEIMVMDAMNSGLWAFIEATPSCCVAVSLKIN